MNVVSLVACQLLSALLSLALPAPQPQTASQPPRTRRGCELSRSAHAARGADQQPATVTSPLAARRLGQPGACCKPA